MDLKSEKYDVRVHRIVSIRQMCMFHITTFALGHNSFVPIRISE